MNAHNTPATAGATAYGQMRSVLYASAPRETRSAMVARSNATTMPALATSALKTAVMRIESR